MGSVLGQICETMEYGKRVEKGVGKESTVNEVSGRGGGRRRGGGFTSELCKLVLPSSVQHALLPLTRCGGVASAFSIELIVH